MSPAFPSSAHPVSPIQTDAETPISSEPALLNWAVAADWLRSHPLWSQLTTPALTALAQAVQSFSVTADTWLYQEGEAAVGVYVLQTGMVELVQQSSIGQAFTGQSLIGHRHPGELFGYVLVSHVVEGVHQTSAIALTDCELLFLPQEILQRLVADHPVIQQVINHLLTQDLHQYMTRIVWEQMRIQGLQAYIQPIPNWLARSFAPTQEGTNDPDLLGGVWGNSKAARKLLQQIHQATNTVKPVILQAQSGTGKTFLAATIHTHSRFANHPFAELDCAELPVTDQGGLNTEALFGQVGERVGILELLERGTLLLDNVHLLSERDRDRLVYYIQTGAILPNPGLSTAADTQPELPQPNQFGVRLILASPYKLAWPAIAATSIKLFPLAQRKADIPALAQHFLQRFCLEHNRPVLQLDQADLRRLISYDYPGNLAELAEILHRAVMMTPLSQMVMSEQVLWSVQSTKNAFRLDLLTHVAWLRPLLLSRWYPEAIWGVMMAVFVPVVVWGFVGPQSRDSSITLNLFWAWWWPGYLFWFAFVGRLWCAVCPFMVTAEWLRRLSLWLWPRQQLSWNTQWLNRWGAWLLFGGFVVIYLWEQLWDLPHHAYLSAWLLLTITAGAVLLSLIYERRLWCRYLCPIGGMNGLFAKLSMIELRSTQQVCGTQCQTYGCYRGSEATPITFANPLPNEGQAMNGCPLYSHPAQLRDNRDCMLCMTCLKACPNRSPQLNLRFPASDLLDHHQGFWAEVALLLLLCGGVFMHHGHTILSGLGWGDLPLDADHVWLSLPIALLLLAIPAVLTYLAHAIARTIDPQQPNYLTVIYAYLPFTLAANLAHYIPAAMTEAGQLLPVLARTLGLSAAGLPTLTWSLDVAQFLQGVTLLSALVFSPYPLLRITGRSWWSNLPHLLLLIALTVGCFGLMM